MLPLTVAHNKYKHIIAKTKKAMKETLFSVKTINKLLTKGYKGFPLGIITK